MSATATFEQIKEKKYSLSAALYFEAKLEYKEYTKEEFYQEVRSITSQLEEHFAEDDQLNNDLLDNLRRLTYET